MIPECAQGACEREEKKREGQKARDRCALQRRCAPAKSDFNSASSSRARERERERERENWFTEMFCEIVGSLVCLC